MEIIRAKLNVCNLPYRIGKFSDFHIGSPDVNYKLLDFELSKAYNECDEINIAGDVFDLILPWDKRFKIDALHKRLRNSADIINKAVDWGYEILAPRASKIRMIGRGNHEEEVEKHNSVDAVKLLVDRLRAVNPGISYGDYTGFIDYRFSGNHGYRFVVFYHHGAGSGNGESQFKKLVQGFDADLIWVGHRHDRSINGVRRVVCPKAGDEPLMRTIRFAMSGSYMDTYKSKSLGYAAKKLYTPQDQGYVEVLLSLRNHELHQELRA